jgi:membrane associated rhomboid family serine protease
MLNTTPPIVKNLLIINGLILVATFGLDKMGMNLADFLGLHHWSSHLFNPIQLVSYLFMHGNGTHLLLNMFALWMFGRILETEWGPKRFLIFYFVTGIGAALIQLIIVSFELSGIEEQVISFQQNPSTEVFKTLYAEFGNYIPYAEQLKHQEIVNFFNNSWAKQPQDIGLQSKAIAYADYLLECRRSVATVGASGSVFGILLAFGMLYPNARLMLIFPPIPIKAKYMVIGYGLFELGAGLVNSPEDNVAHFAHLGGMLFGYLLIKYWKNTRKY